MLLYKDNTLYVTHYHLHKKNDRILSQYEYVPTTLEFYQNSKFISTYNGRSKKNLIFKYTNQYAVNSFNRNINNYFIITFIGIRQHKKIIELITFLLSKLNDSEKTEIYLGTSIVLDIYSAFSNYDSKFLNQDIYDLSFKTAIKLVSTLSSLLDVDTFTLIKTKTHRELYVLPMAYFLASLLDCFSTIAKKQEQT